MGEITQSWLWLGYSAVSADDDETSLLTTKGRPTLDYQVHEFYFLLYDYAYQNGFTKTMALLNYVT